MLKRGRYRLVSYLLPWLTLVRMLQACLPREEEGLPVHDHRILRDGELQLRSVAAIAARNTRHDVGFVCVCEAM